MIYQFFEQRVLKVMKDATLPGDIVQAVMKIGYDDFYETVLRAEALAAYVKGEDKAAIKATFDNNGRATTISEKASGVEVNVELFTADEERDLYNAVVACFDQLPAFVENKDQASIIEEFASLNEVVETFFEKILVMDEDLAVRENRLSLVKMYANVLNSYFKLDEVKMA